ncbi:hypothetical protein ZYGR_0AD05470 [Zygosaccharomyces rouxii]|uniref:Tr-type G domain-containing protein n=1 Tax=Zygosaccharomyces rouxii TaxID=4956 RepID=A0A1Q3A6K7_ZYGRO|nr:hypothetical protein ZYGR_0AD05470 [Zygosaccharomyces rouxii]
MDEYDEFGNPVENEQTSLAVKPEDTEPLVEQEPVDNGGHDHGDDEQEVNRNQEQALVPLQDAYGDDVEVLVETEDNQDADVPLVEIAREHEKGPDYSVFTHLKKHVPRAAYDRDYMLGMLEAPERIRNVAVVGPLHSGKTSLVDLLVMESHQNLPHMSRRNQLGWSQMRYMDNTKLEIERGLSLKSNGITFLGFDLDAISFPINLLDAPGHVNFMDETAVCLQAVDCALICIDVVEGVTSVVENLIKYCQRSGLAMVFVLNKLDRLILELKLPPLDSFLKLMHIVDQINHFTVDKFSPELGNVIFASSKLGFSFTIQEFILYYYSPKLPTEKLQGFIERMWGDIYFADGKFSSTPRPSKNPTFVEFILLPIYKIITHTLSNDTQELQNILRRNFGVHLRSEFFKYDPLPLLKHVLELVFRKQTGLTHALVHNCDPIATTSVKLSQSLQSPIEDDQIFLAHALKTMDYGGSEWALVRIYRGQLTPGMQVNVIDSSLTVSGNDQDEEYEQCKIEQLALMGGRYIFPVVQASVGQLVLVKGLSDAFTKSSTLYLGPNTQLPLFKPIDYINEPVARVVIQPLHPKELPKLLSGLNKVSKYYPGVVVKVEESGEHVILGCGELYLDSLLYDLRNNYAKMEIKISDPLTVFAESCAGESFAAIPVNSINGTVSISVGAEPLTPKLVDDLSQNKIAPDVFANNRKLSKMLRSEYGWDSLAARNVWSFQDANVFVDDTLPNETDKEILLRCRPQLNQGFKWVIREGPLANEPIHGVHFKLLSAENLEKVSGGGQLIPMVRRACYIALLTATPILLEPIYEVDVIVHLKLLSIIEELFAKRRGGRIYKTSNIAGSPLMEIRGQLPVIESVGFETDLRLSTMGAGMCQMHFCKKIWRKVPGDVMDEQAVISKLKPSPIGSLSRDFVMKTRRRKGISNSGFMSNDGPSLSKYIEPELYTRLKENGLV